MASIDLKFPVLTMSQFSDSQTYVKTMTKLQILKPLEIVLPNTACENGNVTKLFKMISDQFQQTTISTVQRRYFNETKDLETVMMRQDVVRELTDKEEVFYNLQGVMSKFLDVDHIISLCVQIPKQDTVKTAESKITTVICLKHVLGLVTVLHDFLKDCENQLLKAYCKLYCGAKEHITAQDLPSIFIKVTKFKNTLNFTTADLID
nr:hypothetical protein BaRGS_027676 [Batillaria attramentaria]